MHLGLECLSSSTVDGSTYVSYLDVERVGWRVSETRRVFDPVVVRP